MMIFRGSSGSSASNGSRPSRSKCSARAHITRARNLAVVTYTSNTQSHTLEWLSYISSIHMRDNTDVCMGINTQHKAKVIPESHCETRKYPTLSLQEAI
jgi:hypothetical protein